MATANGSDRPAVLTSWKDIANYMGKGVRTVQRWEQDFGLPVRRASGSKKKAVLARPHDLDMWVALQCQTRAGGNDGEHLTLADSSIRSALAAEVETFRTLRAMNGRLREELHGELIALHETLNAITRGATRRSSDSRQRSVAR